MVATNSVKKRTGNVSVGTSNFVMIVLEKKLSKVYPEVDMVTTPDGSVVAMVHANKIVQVILTLVPVCFVNIRKQWGIRLIPHNYLVQCSIKL